MAVWLYGLLGILHGRVGGPPHSAALKLGLPLCSLCAAFEARRAWTLVHGGPRGGSACMPLVWGTPMAPPSLSRGKQLSGERGRRGRSTYPVRCLHPRQPVLLCLGPRGPAAGRQVEGLGGRAGSAWQWRSAHGAAARAPLEGGVAASPLRLAATAAHGQAGEAGREESAPSALTFEVTHAALQPQSLTRTRPAPMEWA